MREIVSDIERQKEIIQKVKQVAFWKKWNSIEMKSVYKQTCSRTFIKLYYRIYSMNIGTGQW